MNYDTYFQERVCNNAYTAPSQHTVVLKAFIFGITNILAAIKQLRNIIVNLNELMSHAPAVGSARLNEQKYVLCLGTQLQRCILCAEYGQQYLY